MKKSLIIVGFILLVLSLVFFLAPTHLRKAILHGHANIDDYKLFDNRLVEIAKPIPWEIDSLYNQKRINDAYLPVFDTFGTTAFVVIKNNKIRHEQYWDGGSDTTLSNSFSMAKSIVSLLIGCLYDEGKIDLNQNVTDYLPDFKNTNGYQLTIKDLLTMSSGIEWDEGYSSLFSVTTEAYYGRGLENLVTGLDITHKPGIQFEYQSCNTQLLALIVEKASGKKVSAYASDKLWKPLGAEHPALWSVDSKDGIEKAYCCFNSTARDFARIGQMVLDSGQYNQQTILSKDYLAQATSPAIYLKGKDGDSCYYYGYQFWIMNHQGHEIVYARGILGQYIFIIPSLQAVVVRLGKARSDKQIRHAPADAYTYLEAAFEILK